MSNQEGMFSSQEQPAFEEKPGKHVETEQEEESTWQAPVRDPHVGYEEGYIGSSYPGNMQREKIQPGQQKKRWKPYSKHILTIIATIILLIAATRFSGEFFVIIVPFLLFIYVPEISAIQARRSASIEHSQRDFVVDGQATLVLDSRAGKIEIKRGVSYKIEIKSTRISHERSGGRENVQSDYEQQGDKIIVREQHCGRGAWRNHITINYEILLPRQSEIRITQNAGDIDIEGITGQVSISINAGNVSLKDVELEGQSMVGLNAGNITVNGRLEKGGRTTLRSNAGNIDVTLPAESAFQFGGHATIGGVNNQFGAQTVDELPHAQLEAYTNAGSIRVWKR